MKRHSYKFAPFLFTVVLFAAIAQPTQAALQRMVAEIPEGSVATSDGVPGEGAVGAWFGALHVGQMTLRLGLQVEEHGDDTFTAILDSIDQDSKISFDSVVLEDRKLRLGAQAIGASYEGTLNADGSALEGVWSQGGRELPLTFHRQKKAFALNRPQHPKGPFPYESHEVTFRSDAGNVRLEGTFIVPAGDGPFPAVAMVTGSGPQDRDETVMGHKPFLVIADALARRCIASLRWDDRGVGKSGGDHLGSTVDEFAADARAAVSFLSSRPEVNASAVGIVGHSEGGLTGPMVAVQILPGLNHLFQHAETGGMEEYGVIEETFAPAALERISAWIEARFGRPKDEPSPTGTTRPQR